VSLPGFTSAVLLTLAGGWLLYLGKSILLPFVIALFLWHVIHALAEGLMRLPPWRRLALPQWPALLLAVCILLGGGWFGAAIIVDNFNQIAEVMPAYTDNLQQQGMRVMAWFGIEELPALEHILGQFQVAPLLGALFASLASMVGSGGAALLYLLLLFLEEHSFPIKIELLFREPERARRVRRILQAIAADMRTYLWMKTVISMSTALLSWAVMALLGLDFAAFWAALIFALNFIPDLGSLLAVALPALIGLVQFPDLFDLALLAGGLGAIQVVMGNVLEPRMMGQGLNLSPLAMLLALAVWGSLWGGVGLFLAVPIMVIAMIILANMPPTRPLAVLLSRDGSLRHQAS